MAPTRKMYVAEDADVGSWLEAPHEPRRPWAEGNGWWKCDRCGQSMKEGEDDAWVCKFCSQVRSDGE